MRKSRIFFDKPRGVLKSREDSGYARVGNARYFTCIILWVICLLQELLASGGYKQENASIDYLHKPLLPSKGEQVKTTIKIKNK